MEYGSATGALRMLLLVILCLLASACAELRKQGQLRLANDVNEHIAENKEAIKPADIDACIAKRSDLPKNLRIVGKPAYEPNAFFTCLVRRIPQSVTLISRANFMVYEVRLTFDAAVPGVKNVFIPEAGGTTLRKGRFICAFLITEEGVKAYEPGARDGIFNNEIIPDKVAVNHPCNDMPGAQDYLGEIHRYRNGIRID